MNNSVFGKTIKNIRKGQNVTLIDNRGKALKLSSKPNFERCKIFDGNLIAVHIKKLSFILINLSILAKQFLIYQKRLCLIFITII